jgi:tyrosyl-tRNA synthetase
MTTFEEQRRVLLANTAEVIPSEEFDERLRESIESRKPLRVKLGLDPGAKHVTLGWTVVLRKLRQFQDFGHTAVLIVGDLTARVGDPSGKSETRKPLSVEEVEANAQAVLDQFGLVLSEENLEIRRNSEWLESMNMADVLKLTSHYTVARMLERDDFAKRYKAGIPISMMEFLYPLLQGSDSVAVQSDIELGGTDQTFNNLMGRVLQERYGQRGQMVMTMPLLIGTDGVRVMGQSCHNYIGVTEPPEEIFGKVMSLPDETMMDYYRLVTDLSLSQVEQIEKGLDKGRLHPAEAKRRLAKELVRMYHGEAAAEAAQERFDLVHKEHGVPEEVPGFELDPTLVDQGKVWLPRLLASAGLASSNSDGRRLIEQGGVQLDGEAVRTEELEAEGLHGRVLQVGRRRFVRLLMPAQHQK